MRARAPLDVDLEDKLLYGLTPIRLGYLLLSLLAGMAIWNAAGLPSPLRAIGCLLVVGAGAAAAWGRWRGRASDEWLTDLAHYTIRNHRLVVDPRVLDELIGSFARWRRKA